MYNSEASLAVFEASRLEKVFSIISLVKTSFVLDWNA